MITEIVSFDLPPGTTRQHTQALYETTIAGWKAHPTLIRKYYLYDGEAGIGGGVYLWPDRASAEAAHGPAWQDRAKALYGSRPRFAYFETPFVVEGGGA